MFKEKFKYYKSRIPPPSLEDVINFQQINKHEKEIHQIKLSSLNDKSTYFGLKSPSTWEVYEMAKRPGLLFIKNPFTALGQKYWTVRCLKDYSRKPNRANLDPFNLLPKNCDWWEACQNGNRSLLEKLRWITLGYHHNWDTKIYSEENKGQFPEDLRNMTVFIAKTIGFEGYSPEAAIVNYYHMDSTLSGHTDHSERNMEAPLFSFSFGQTAVFLIGGKSLEDEAVSLFLQSGDIVVMSKESRLCYHGVPRIIPAQLSVWNDPECNNDECSFTEVCLDTLAICKDQEQWLPFGEYLRHSRINMNVRQVLYDGEKKLYNG